MLLTTGDSSPSAEPPPGPEIAAGPSRDQERSGGRAVPASRTHPGFREARPESRTWWLSALPPTLQEWDPDKPCIKGHFGEELIYQEQIRAQTIQRRTMSPTSWPHPASHSPKSGHLGTVQHGPPPSAFHVSAGRQAVAVPRCSAQDSGKGVSLAAGPGLKPAASHGSPCEYARETAPSLASPRA